MEIFLCNKCNVELDKPYEICPICGARIEYVNESKDDNEECRFCERETCVDCQHWRHYNIETKTRYCEECGHELEIWLHQPQNDGSYDLLWHCTECGCDYKNEWRDGQETELERKFWG